MPYAPGIQYIGGQLLGQGMQQAGAALGGGLQDALRTYVKNKEEDQFVTQRLENLAPQLKKYMTYEAMADESGPAAQLVSNLGKIADKPLAKKKAALVDAVLFIAKKEDEQKRKEAEQWHLLTAQHQQAQDDLALKQFGLAQDADKRAAELAAVMLPYHKLQTAGLMQAQQENEAIGNALGAFSRGGTNVSPVSYSDWAARAGVQLGGTPPPVGSTPFTYEDRVNRALQTPGLGGRGAVQLLGTLERFAPKEPDELKRLQAVKLGLEIEGMRNPDKSFGIVDLEKATGDPGLRGRYGVLKTGAVERVGGYNLPEGLPSVPGHTPVPDGKGGIVWLKVPEESDLTDMSKPPTTPAPPGYSWVADKGRWTQKPIPKAAVLQGLMGGTNAPAATTSPQNSTTSGKYKVSW